MDPISASFKLTLLVVTLIAAVSFIGLVLLAFLGSDAASVSDVPQHQARLSETCDFGFRPASAVCWDYWGGKTS